MYPTGAPITGGRVMPQQVAYTAAPSFPGQPRPVMQAPTVMSGTYPALAPQSPVRAGPQQVSPASTFVPAQVPQSVRQLRPVATTTAAAAPQVVQTVRTASTVGVAPGTAPVVRRVLPTSSAHAGVAPVITQGHVMPMQYPQGYPVVTAARPLEPKLSPQEALTKNMYEAKHADDAQLSNLKELKKHCGLKEVAVGDALKVMQLATASGGSLSRQDFLAAYEALLSQQGIPVPSAATQNAVFDLFDRDDNDVVDLMELICGISLLCKGSEDDKIHAVFSAFDANGDGFISMDEMFKFLTAVFKVVMTPNVKSAMATMGVPVDSAEDLASVTALECFKTSDLNEDGKLNVEEFKQWFYMPRNDPSFLFNPVRKMLQ
eukprot:TRINITY_DN9512_c0_g1_i1.p2 TRINITY_DN9512_c0_g1~~TRINITY_DN9512_c0_g1_i1.p2  ORF type:complete len:375 (-),score=95.03 TRINITY_DN9512_c0_g1_i1:109-1233(-)